MAREGTDGGVLYITFFFFFLAQKALISNRFSQYYLLVEIAHGLGGKELGDL